MRERSDPWGFRGTAYRHVRSPRTETTEKTDSAPAIQAAAPPIPACAPKAGRAALGCPSQVPPGEAALRRILHVPNGPRQAGDDQAYRLFSLSIAISAARCLLTYIVVPFLVPLVGPVAGDSPTVGIPLSVVALVFDIRALRGFWLAEHRWRRPMTALYGVVMAMVAGLLVHDILALR